MRSAWRLQMGTSPALEVWAWLLLCVALRGVYVYISETLAGPGQDLWFFFSSDTVQYGLIYRDLFEDGFRFGGWNISHAPEYVQMAVALILRSLADTLTAGHVYEAMTQPVLLALALRFTLRRVWPDASSLGPFVAALVLWAIPAGYGSDWIAFVWSNRHGYTQILTILSLGLLLDVTRGASRSVRPSLVLALVVVLGTASDMLFLVWFVAPALVAATIPVFVGRREPARRAVKGVAGGGIIGLAIFWVVTPVITVGSKLQITISGTWDALNRISDQAFKSSPEHTLTAIVTLAGFLIAAGVAWRSADLGRRVAGVFVMALLFSTLIAVAATAAPFREEGYTRYFLAPQLSGLVTVVGVAASAVGRWGMPLLATVLSVVVVLGLRPLPATIPPATAYYPPLVECLDSVAQKHRLQYGVADYWLAKYVTALSKSGLRVVAVTPRLDPFVDFTNVEWFLGGVGAKRHDRPRYTFTILGTRRPEGAGVSTSALSVLGAPVAVEHCEGFELQVLPLGADERIRQQFRENPSIKAYYAREGLIVPGVP